MAGITVCRHQRAGAREVLDDALRVAADPWPSWTRSCYRQWLTTPSEGLRVLLGQAGENADHWHRHRAPALLAQWSGSPQADAA